MKATTEDVGKRHGLAVEQRPRRAGAGGFAEMTVPPRGGLVIGDLVALKDDGVTALVLFPGQDNAAAVAARCLIDLYGRDVGSQVALMFEDGAEDKPIVVGLVRERRRSWPPASQEVQAEVEADGERLVVTARQQLTLRCGSASITLTKEGKVLIQGTFVSTRSAGVNRIVGGSVQIN